MVKPGKTYEVELWIKAENARGNMIYLNGELDKKTLPTGTYDWKSVTYEISTDDEQTSLNITINLNSLTDTLWVDNISVKAVSYTHLPVLGGNYWQGDCLQICMGLPEESFGDEIGFSYDETNGKPYISLPAEISDKAELIQSGFLKDGNILKYEMAIPWNVEMCIRDRRYAVL